LAVGAGMAPLTSRVNRPVSQATGPEAVMPPTIQPLLVCWTL
jgi:hypothetical protein